MIAPAAYVRRSRAWLPVSRWLERWPTMFSVQPIAEQPRRVYNLIQTANGLERVWYWR